MEQTLAFLAQLIKNFEFVQMKIDEIHTKEQIDIKQISDLQRYTEMQKNIAETIYYLIGGKR